MCCGDEIMWIVRGFDQDSEVCSHCNRCALKIRAILNETQQNLNEQ